MSDEHDEGGGPNYQPPRQTMTVEVDGAQPITEAQREEIRARVAEVLGVQPSGVILSG